MRITAELSLYPLHNNFVADVVSFIEQLRKQPGLDIVTNRMSTQIRGQFDEVTGAVNHCLEYAFQHSEHMVLIVKYLNADLDINSPPDLD